MARSRRNTARIGCERRRIALPALRSRRLGRGDNAGLLPMSGLKSAIATTLAEGRRYSILSATHGSTPAALRAG